MNKLVDFLEKRVEWVALGLAVLFAVYMAYSYLLVPKVIVSNVAPQPMAPGEVDRYIRENVAADLEARMVPSNSAANDTVKPPSFVESFMASMSYANEPAKPLQYAKVYLPHTDMITLDPTKVQTPGGPAPEAPRNEKAPVKELATLPAPIIEKVTTGLSNVLPQPATGVAADPMALPAGQQGVDKSWTAVLFHIDAAAMQAAFDKMNIPAAQASTTLLRVVVERQELEPSGKWSAPMVVAPLAISNMQAFPAEDAELGTKAVYNQWATQHVVEILRPTFYQRLQGDVWGFVEQKQNVAAVAAQTFDPNQYLTVPDSELMKLTMDQRRQVAAAKAAQRRANRASRGPAQATPRRGAPAEDIIIPGVFDPERASFQVLTEEQRLLLPEPALPITHPMNRDTAISLGLLKGTGGGTTAAPDTAVTEQGEAGVGTAPGVTAPIPPGQFVPGEWVKANPQTPNIVGWFSDDTVQPGRTYRYRVTYLAKSPVFFMQQLVQDPKLAEVFALKSEPSEWSSPIEIASTINFWIVTQRNNANTVSIQVFRWIAGQPKTKTYDIAPGDKIGTKIGDIDFTTGWTMVDLRTDLRGADPYVLLLDPEGRIHRRDVRTDATDPRFQKLRETATSVAAR